MECKIEETPQNLIELKRITSSLSFSRFAKQHGSTVEFDMTEGVGYMVGIMQKEQIAVAKNICGKDALFPQHAHEVWELLVVYKGTMHLTVDGEIKILNEKDFYYLNPGTPHSAYFPIDCEFLAITMPSADEWPGVNGE